MKRAVTLAFAPILILAGCAATPPAPPGLVAAERLVQAPAPGTSTMQQVQAALGPATTVRFDSGYQVWLYLYQPAPALPPGPGGKTQYAEFVILFGPDGVVVKTRRREPSAEL